MKNINKIINIALIFMLIAVFLCQDISAASCLRVPVSKHTNSRILQALDKDKNSIDPVYKEALREKIDSIGIRFYPGRKEVFNLEHFINHIVNSDIFEGYDKDWGKYIEDLSQPASKAFLQLVDYFGINTESYIYRIVAQHKYIEKMIPGLIAEKIKKGQEPVNIKIVTLGGSFDPVSLGATAIESIKNSFPDLILGKDIILKIEEVNISKKEMKTVKNRLVSGKKEEFSPKDLHAFKELAVRDLERNIYKKSAEEAKNHIKLVNENKESLRKIIKFKQGSITDEKLMAGILRSNPDLIICNYVFYQLLERNQMQFIYLLGRDSSENTVFLFSFLHEGTAGLFDRYFKTAKISKRSDVYEMKKSGSANEIEQKIKDSRDRIPFAQLVGESPKIIDIQADDASFLFKVRGILPRAELYGVDFSFENNIQAEALKRNIILLGGLNSIKKGIHLLNRSIKRDNLQKPIYDVVTLMSPKALGPREFFETLNYILKPDGIAILRLDDYYDSETREQFEEFIKKLSWPGNDEIWEVADVKIDMDGLEGKYREREPVVIRRKKPDILNSAEKKRELREKLKESLSRVEDFIKNVDANGLKIEDKMLLNYAIAGADDIKTILNEIINKDDIATGENIVGPAWNSSWHLLTLLAGFTKAGAIDEKTWEITKNYFDIVKSGAEKWLNNNKIIDFRSGNITNESIAGRQVLTKLGPQIEEYARQICHDNSIKIAIIPMGSILKGYAGAKSDIEYRLIIMRGNKAERGEGGDINYKLYELIKEEGFRGEPMLTVPAPILSVSKVSDGYIDLDELGGGNEDMAIDYLSDLFLPIAYGDKELIEKARKNIILFVSKHEHPEEFWSRLQEKYFKHLRIQYLGTGVKPHLEQWLVGQGVSLYSLDTVAAFNKKRIKELGLPDLNEMKAIYNITENDVFNSIDTLKIPSTALQKAL